VDGRQKALRFVAAFAVAVVTATVVVAPAGPAMAAVPEGAIFNTPGVPGAQDAIVTHLRGLIDGAPAGSTISIALYHLNDATTAERLVTAKDRGVRVRVVLDHTSNTTAATSILRAGLGTNRSATSWLTVCTPGAACIGTLDSPIMHNKFFLFSSTSGSTDVVVQTSANLTASNTSRYWNNALTLVGNTGLYQAYLGYFGDLANQVKTNNYYSVHTSGNARAYFFPRAGSGAGSDTIYNMLNENVTCEGNTTVGTATGRTIIRIGMWWLSRDAIAGKLRELADRKCWVDVVYYHLDANTTALLSGHPRIMLYQINDEPAGQVVHSKYMLIEGTYAGQRDSKWVFTGSHNYSNAGLRENDEALIRLRSDAIHDQYRANFRQMRDAATG
jgi:phosphatidylserine/phosphatidylglycerophosphate/cardiolipin synthase-like enzyme